MDCPSITRAGRAVDEKATRHIKGSETVRRPAGRLLLVGQFAIVAVGAPHPVWPENKITNSVTSPRREAL
jgi:hypothetical protein